MNLEKQKRPADVPSSTSRVDVGCGHLYITVTLLEGQPFEVFATLGKAGGCANCQNEALTRAVTMGLRYGIPASEYVRQLKGIRCPSPGLEASSCADAVAAILQKIIEKPIDKLI